MQTYVMPHSTAATNIQQNTTTLILRPASAGFIVLDISHTPYLPADFQVLEVAFFSFAASFAYALRVLPAFSCRFLFSSARRFSLFCKKRCARSYTHMPAIAYSIFRHRVFPRISRAGVNHASIVIASPAFARHIYVGFHMSADARARPFAGISSRATTIIIHDARHRQRARPPCLTPPRRDIIHSHVH